MIRLHNRNSRGIETLNMKNKDYRAWETADIIHDLTLGNPPRHPADTPEKKAKVKRLKKAIAEAASKGHVIHVTE